MIGMGVFEFIILIVLISTIGKVVTARTERRRLPKDGPDQKEIDQLNEAVSDLSTRLSKIEEERDFYRALLESPDRNSLPEPPP